MAHNFYSSRMPSGENRVFIAEKAMLKKNGVEVITLTKDSDDIYKSGRLGVLSAALQTPWNWSAAAEARELQRKENPQILHVHNTFPLISPSIFHAVRHPAARIMTLHNFRMVCPAAIPMRDGSICTECIRKKSALPSVLHGCYRGSRIATLPLAIMSQLHRHIGTWNSHIDALITLSDFQREIMIQAGFPESKIHVKPNFSSITPKNTPWQERGNYAVFIGRLGEEKGVHSLLKAWKLWGNSAPELRIIGDGELNDFLRKQAEGLPVKFLGQISPEDVMTQISQSKLQILPSEWFETFGLAVIEAFAHATPAAVSRIGALPSIVQDDHNGLIFEPGNPISIMNTIRDAWHSPGKLERLGKAAQADFKEKYTEQQNFSLMMRIYNTALENVSHAK